MRVALLLMPFVLVACLAPFEEDIPVRNVTHETTNIVVQQQQQQSRTEPDYTSLFRDAGPIADPTPTGITVEEPVEPVEPTPRGRVYIGGSGGSVVMNNVTIHGDVYIGSMPERHAAVVPTVPSGATIQACEAYVDRVETCSTRMLGSSEAAQRIIDSMEAARRTWRRFAGDPRVRDSLVDSCTVARRQYDASAASYCDGS
jgi:hypothetical protein